MINSECQQLIDNIDARFQQITAIKDTCSHYKLGNVYIKKLGITLSIELNAIGEPHKYQVVQISPMGIAFLQRLSSNGTPSGEVILAPEAEGLRWQLRTLSPGWQFAQDPDQLDAIMLQQEYIPMRLHNEKLHLRYEINKHNRSNLIPTGFFNKKIYTTFLKNLQTGDKIWTSIDRQYVVYAPVEKQGNKWIITLLDMNQKQVKYPLSYFDSKRLYKNKPRSFAKEVEK